MTSFTSSDEGPEITSTERWASGNRVTLLLASAALLGSVAAIWAAARSGPLPGERDLTVAIQNAILWPNAIQPFDFVDGLSTPVVAIVTVLSGAAIALRRIGPRAALLVLSAAGVIVVNGAAKALLGSTGAFAQTTGNLTDNFPSGHASYAVAVLGAFAWLGWLRRTPELAAIAVPLILAMGLARVARGAHVPSDVLGGYFLGAAWLLICIAASSGPTTAWERAVRRAP